MALLKFLFVLTTLLMAFTAQLSWLSKTQVIATRDVNHDSEVLEGMLLLPSAKLMTCGRSCTYSEECSDGWACNLCIFITQEWKACSAF
ncbi:hypothetical protein A4A49_57073 [Nicotiana attenuata]|uniref:Carboxypeptidase A inhibitor-like domain-containing protein n=1 Tax=Nicotiana attenuata TaxID=49451 RepID=A0A314L353_NICAT|nr:hypothetical protein A4A49_24166 [Nicotiana attenuata]OIT36131.1 hypothetical protein A4A49_57073 [Nicotiana attenuata]